MEKIYTCDVPPSVIERAQYDADAYNDFNAKIYAKRNQKNTKKINRDMVIGLSFELGSAYPYLCEQFGNDNVEEPYVYDGTNGKKEQFSHNADIVVFGDLNFHCKCIDPEVARTYGYGWLFEKNYLDKNEEKLRKSEKDFVVFGSLDLNNRTSDILVIQRFGELFENDMFEVPVMRYLRDGKRVVKYSKFIEKKVAPKIEINKLIDTMTIEKEEI